MQTSPDDEIEAIFSGKPYKLCLTLGALIEISENLALSAADDLPAAMIGEKPSAQDLVLIFGAALRAAGNDISNDEVKNLRHARGISGFLDVLDDLLVASFPVICLHEKNEAQS